MGLWVLLVIVSWIDNPDLWYLGLLAITLIPVIYFILGVTTGGKIGLKVPLIYPAFVMALLWVIAFTIAYTTGGQAADTWILGLHKGQFWVLFLFWVGNFLTSALSYALYFDKYVLPRENWESFLKEVEQAKQANEDDKNARTKQC